MSQHKPVCACRPLTMSRHSAAMPPHRLHRIRLLFAGRGEQGMSPDQKLASWHGDAGFPSHRTGAQPVWCGQRRRALPIAMENSSAQEGLPSNTPRDWRDSCGKGPRRAGLEGGGELHGEFCPLSQAALEADAATHLLDEGFGDGEAQARAALPGCGARG